MFNLGVLLAKTIAGASVDILNATRDIERTITISPPLPLISALHSYGPGRRSILNDKKRSGAGPLLVFSGGTYRNPNRAILDRRTMLAARRAEQLARRTLLP